MYFERFSVSVKVFMQLVFFVFKQFIGIGWPKINFYCFISFQIYTIKSKRNRKIEYSKAADVDVDDAVGRCV